MITTRLLRASGALAGAFLLSGCLSNGTLGTLPQTIYDSLEGNATLKDTPTLPTSGTATYTGSALLQTGTSGFAKEQTFAAGEATLDVDFANPSMSGKLTNFQGANNIDPLVFQREIYSQDVDRIAAALKDFSPAAGEITVSTVAVTGGRFDVGYDGSLDVDGTTVTVGGTGSGYILGPNAEGVKLYGSTFVNNFGQQMTVKADGTDQFGSVYINAQK